MCRVPCYTRTLQKDPQDVPYLKCILEKGMLQWQTHLAPSSWDVNSSEAMAAWSNKLAQAPD